MKAKLIKGLSQIQSKYDAFFIDLWGVVHNGIQVYPGAISVMENLNKIKKTELETLQTFRKEIPSIYFNHLLVDFILESRKFVDLVNDGNFDKVKKFVEKSPLLFKGPCGVRHVDFIAHKEV